jgi:hypothetical protein
VTQSASTRFCARLAQSGIDLVVAGSGEISPFRWTSYFSLQDRRFGPILGFRFGLLFSFFFTTICFLHMGFLRFGYELFAPEIWNLCLLDSCGGTNFTARSAAVGSPASISPAATRGKNSNKLEETNMNSKIAFTALSLAIVLGSASVAAAAAKKQTGAGKAYGSAAATTVDPREAYVATHPGGTNPTWCDAEPSCNGWGKWLEGVSTGKMKY